MVTIGTNTKSLVANESIHIPTDISYSIKNSGFIPLELIKVGITTFFDKTELVEM